MTQQFLPRWPQHSRPFRVINSDRSIKKGIMAYDLKDLQNKVRAGIKRIGVKERVKCTIGLKEGKKEKVFCSHLPSWVFYFVSIVTNSHTPVSVLFDTLPLYLSPRFPSVPFRLLFILGTGRWQRILQPTSTYTLWGSGCVWMMIGDVIMLKCHEQHCLLLHLSVVRSA